MMILLHPAADRTQFLHTRLCPYFNTIRGPQVSGLPEMSRSQLVRTE